MAKKKSENEKDFLGNEYEQYYDENGNKIGYSEIEVGFWGEEYTQHYDNDGNKTGYSIEEKDFWGEDYIQHRTQDGTKDGYSEEEKNLWGDEYIRHNNEQGRKLGQSEDKKDLWGNEYTEHTGKLNKSVYKPNYNSNSDADGALVTLVIYFVLFMVAVYIIIVVLIIALTIIALISPIAAFIYHFVSKDKPKWALITSLLLSLYLMIDFNSNIIVSNILNDNFSIGLDGLNIISFVYGALATVPAFILVEKLLANKYPYSDSGKFFEKTNQRKGSIIASLILFLGLFFGLPSINSSSNTSYTNTPVNINTTSQPSNNNTYNNTPSVNSNISKRKAIIRKLVNAEDNRDMNIIKSILSSNMNRYWTLTSPSSNDVYDQYQKAWETTSYSNNNIISIRDLNEYEYILNTKFYYTLRKSGKQKNITSEVYVKFDTNNRIIDLHEY